MIASRSVLLRIRNISDQNFRESQNTRFSSIFFLESRAIDKKMWENVLQPDRPQIK
jgi:hypothetical protein